MKQFSLISKLYIIILVCMFTTPVLAQTCQLAITVSTTDSRCKATGSITVTATNGSGNYNYIVTGMSYNINTSANIIDGLKPGSYTVKVKDISTGCTEEQTNVTVGGSYQDPRFNLLATDVTCFNAANGSITVNNVQYGTAPFTFTIISPSASQVGVTNTSGVFSALTAGDYYIQLSDSCGGLQTRVMTIANYSWTPSLAAITKPACDTAEVTISASDNRGSTNAAGSVFNTFSYGATVVAGDTIWSANRTFRFFKGSYRHGSLIIKDGCGNIRTLPFTDTSIPNVNASVVTNNYQCSDFTATVTGQQNLNNPQYCLYNNSNVLIGCNTNGVFNNIPYGSYCIGITDNCYDTTFNRCFTVGQPAVSVSGTVNISNQVCSGFDAAITGQQNLASPQYCLYDSVNTLISCNATGVFTNIPYGPYCINITDGCTGTVITRCFTRRKLMPVVATNVTYSNLSCSTFSVGVSGQANIVNPQYCLYDIDNNVIGCNTTGVFNGLAYGTYCMHIQNDPLCYDTVIQRCFTVGAPVPAINTVVISNKTCAGFTASVNGQMNLTSPTYYLLDVNNIKIDSNATGVFNNLAYGAYCIQMKNDGTCFDTTIQRCFSQTVPVPAVGATVNITNKACNTFSAALTGLSNLTNPRYYLLDNTSAAIDSNSTGVFNNIPYGSYCILTVNTCYDTTFTRCFSATASPITIGVSSAASCTIGKTSLTVTISNGVAPYTINIYNPWGMLVNTTNSGTATTVINGLAGLPTGFQYKIVASGSCSGVDSANITPNTWSLTKSINANSKCPGGLWLNGSGDLLVNAQFSGGTVTPSIIQRNGTAVNVSFTTQSGSNFTFTNMQPANYIVKYTLQGCGTTVYDTFDLKPYDYPNLDQSAVYQCNNNNFSVSAAATGGLAPFTYEIIGSSPASPAIIQAPQVGSTFGISNGTTYSLVRLRIIDACGNAAINDASILPLSNTIVKSSSDCFYNDIKLTVDSIPNAIYSWYKKTSATDSMLISNNQTFSITNLLPPDTGVYVSVVSVNSGCLTRISSFRVTGACGGGLLAVNGLSFSAAPEKENVQLKWTTAKSFDATSFIVERSTDGNNFKVIGSAAVSSNNKFVVSQYYFSDMNAVTGKNYYRLRIIKTNGSIAYTDVQIVSKKGKISVSVMPNPVAESFTIRFQPAASANYTVSLVSAEGKVVLNSTYAVRPGDAKTIQRPGTIATGVYYLLVLNQSTSEKEIIKLFFK
ncbi:MAG: hypothetical protein ABIU63_02105 [Chitinophagaceae bacterium]